MPTVHLAFSPDAAYVRTVRLVVAAVARRAGVADELLDEVRLAIGEACTRAVALHRRQGRKDLVDISMTDGGRFVVRVTDRGPAEAARAELVEAAGGGFAGTARAGALSAAVTAAPTSRADAVNPAGRLADPDPRTAEPRTAEPRTAEPRTAEPSTAEASSEDPDANAALADEEEITAGVGLALLTGLVSDLSVGSAPDGGTEVRMSWPLARRERT